MRWPGGRATGSDMKRRGFSVVEAVAVVAIIGILAAILYPVLRRRPLLWSRTVMAPQHFRNAELQQVVLQLHRELFEKRKMSFLNGTRWENPGLRHRRITFDTTQEMTLKEVLALVEKKGGIAFQGAGSCGTCGYAVGALTVVAAAGKKVP